MRECDVRDAVGWNEVTYRSLKLKKIGDAYLSTRSGDPFSQYSYRCLVQVLMTGQRDLPLASLAVVSSRRFEGFAFSAPALPLCCLRVVRDVGSELFMPVLWYAAWVCQTAPPVAYQQRCNKCIKYVCIPFPQWAWFDIVEQPLRCVRQEADKCGNGRWREFLK
jgi:hypothetical protein